MLRVLKGSLYYKLMKGMTIGYQSSKRSEEMYLSMASFFFPTKVKLFDSRKEIRDFGNDHLPQKPIQKVFLPLLGSLRESLSMNRSITKLHINGIHLNTRAMKLLASVSFFTSYR
jgi:hypothetical protein